MAYTVMAYIVMTYIVMAHIVMAHIVMAHRVHNRLGVSNQNSKDLFLTDSKSQGPKIQGL